MAQEGTPTQEPQEPGSSPVVGQEPGPSPQGGAAETAPTPSPTTEKGPEEDMVPMKRLAGLQSGFQKKFDQQDKLLQQRSASHTVSADPNEGYDRR